MTRLLFILIFCFITAECGLLNDILISKSDGSKNEEKAKADLLNKVVKTLENGTIIVIDALGNVIGIDPNKIDDGKAKNAKLNTKDNKIKAENEIKTEKPAGQLNDTKLEEPKVNTTSSNSDKVPTLPTDTKEKQDMINKVNGTEITTTKPDVVKEKNCKNGTCKDFITKSSLVADDCPTGKSRADDQTCVNEE